MYQGLYANQEIVKKRENGHYELITVPYCLYIALAGTTVPVICLVYRIGAGGTGIVPNSICSVFRSWHQRNSVFTLEMTSSWP
jgi:hypothetical protein